MVVAKNTFKIHQYLKNPIAVEYMAQRNTL